MAVASNTTVGQKAWYYSLRVYCALFFFFLLAPVFTIVPLSFNDSPFFTYPMEGYSFRWYEEIFGDSPQSLQWQRAFLNSVIIAFGATVLSMALGTLAALGLSSSKFPFKNTILAVLISPMIVPIVVTASGMFYFYAQLGIINTLFGLILAHTALGVPFVVLTVTATLMGFDHNLVRAASVLGARPITIFFKVTLPLIFPGVASGGIFAFATSWDEIVVVLFLASAGEHTVPRRMWSGIRDNISPSIIAAATLLILLSILLLLTMEWLRRRGERMRGITLT